MKLLSLRHLLLLPSIVAAFTPLPLSSFRSRHCAFTSDACLSETSTSSDANSSIDSDTDDEKFTVNMVLTREKGKNGKLQKLISEHPTTKMLQSSMKVNLIELPCIEHDLGEDLEEFKVLVQNKNNDAGEGESFLDKFDYVIITSPESAEVFAWAIRGDENQNNEMKISPKIAAVGKSTKATLEKLGFEVDFTPTKADGQSLAEQLPYVDKVKLTRVLYPASAKAADTIQEILESRKDASFSLTRFNTYDTVPVTFTQEQLDVIMGDVHIACFGSPSSVDSFLANVDRALGNEDLSDEDKKAAPNSNGNTVACCIGPTSARRCLESGRWHAMNIYYPKKNPGMEGWADSCLQAAGDTVEQSFWS